MSDKTRGYPDAAKFASNFLYDTERQRGVLVDFGLAEVKLAEPFFQYILTGNSERVPIINIACARIIQPTEKPRSMRVGLGTSQSLLDTQRMIQDRLAEQIELGQEGSEPPRCSLNALRKRPRSISGQ